MFKKYMGLALAASLAFAQQGANAIHLKNNDGAYVHYDGKTIGLTDKKEEASNFLLKYEHKPFWGKFPKGHHHKGKKSRASHEKEEVKNEETQEGSKHYAVLIPGIDSSFLHKIVFDGTNLMLFTELKEKWGKIPHKDQEVTTSDNEENLPKVSKKRSKKAYMKASKKAAKKARKAAKRSAKKAKKDINKSQHHTKHMNDWGSWNPAEKGLLCTIEGNPLPKDSTDEQLNGKKLTFTHKDKEGKETTSVLTIEKK